MPSANTASVASTRATKASLRERGEVVEVARDHHVAHAAVADHDRHWSVVVAWLPGGPVSSPSTPLDHELRGPAPLAARTSGLPTFRGLVEACTSSEASAIETSFTPSCRSFSVYAFSTACGVAPPPGCSWMTSIAVERSSVYSRSAS